MVGGHDIDNSPIMLGIPVDIEMARDITRSPHTDVDRINRHLHGLTPKTDIRIQSIEGSHGKYILGYNIINASHINGPLINVTALLKEIGSKKKRFKSDILRLNPKLSDITLSLFEAEPDEIIVNIKDLEPYLFDISI